MSWQDTEMEFLMFYNLLSVPYTKLTRSCANSNPSPVAYVMLFICLVSFSTFERIFIHFHITDARHKYVCITYRLAHRKERSYDGVALIFEYVQYASNDLFDLNTMTCKCSHITHYNKPTNQNSSPGLYSGESFCYTRLPEMPELPLSFKEQMSVNDTRCYKAKTKVKSFTDMALVNRDVNILIIRYYLAFFKI